MLPVFVTERPLVSPLRALFHDALFGSESACGGPMDAHMFEPIGTPAPFW